MIFQPNKDISDSSVALLPDGTVIAIGDADTDNDGPGRFLICALRPYNWIQLWGRGEGISTVILLCLNLVLSWPWQMRMSSPFPMKRKLYLSSVETGTPSKLTPPPLQTKRRTTEKSIHTLQTRNIMTSLEIQFL